jgi:hypothetical protein
LQLPTEISTNLLLPQGENTRPIQIKANNYKSNSS